VAAGGPTRCSCAPDPTAMNRILGALRRRGVRHAAWVTGTRIADTWHEWRLGLRAPGLGAIGKLIDEWQDCHDYSPTSVAAFRLTMREVAVRVGVDVFIDLGAGKGRVVALAAQYPFRRVQGVEISPQLVAAARVNLERCRPFLRCPDVEL